MEVGCFFIDSEGNIIGNEDTSKLENLNHYQRYMCSISESYRRHLITLKPFETGLVTNEPDEWSKKGIIYSNK